MNKNSQRKRKKKSYGIDFEDSENDVNNGKSVLSIFDSH